MALSPNYGWAEPDNSSLVKNGAQDIRALGDAIDTSVWNVGFGQAGKNKIINGNFGVWQRGTTFTSIADGAYSADRYITAFNGTGVRSITQQTFTPATAPVAGYEGQYFLRIDQTTAGTGASANRFSQRIEDVRTFAGQTATFSFWAKAASAITLPSLGIVQNFGSGGSAGVGTNVTSSIAITTSWQRFSYTLAVPSISGKTVGTSSYLEVRFELPINSTFTFDIWGVQAEYGSKATPFQTATGTIQGELAACQRYYWRNTPGTNYGAYGVGVAGSTTVAYIPIFLPVPMRITPTSIDVPTSASNLQLTNWGTTSWTPSAISIDASGSTFNTITVQATTTGLVTGQAVTIRNNNGSTSSYFIGASAEL
jgi:hypothetical protein